MRNTPESKSIQGYLYLIEIIQRLNRHHLR